MEKIKKGMNLEQQEFVDLIFYELDQIPCTGWVDRKVKNPETVLGHSIKGANMAKKIFSLIKGLRIILLIHDWPEVKTGDLRTDPLAPKQISTKEKEERELKAMKELCSALGKRGKYIFALWKEFEAGKTNRAKIARQVERTQRIIKALYYERIGEPVIAQEFIDYYGPSITNKKLKHLIQSAEAQNKKILQR